MNKTPSQLLIDLIEVYGSLRNFARAINEDASDVMRWKSGKHKIKARAVISICKLRPEIKPHELNPLIFPEELTFQFGEKKDE